jgi:hypothetical protein
MTRTTLNEQLPAFADRTPFLDLVLGLISATRRFDALLERHGPMRVSRSSNAAENDPSTDFVLGLIAFRRRIEATVAGARARRAAPPATPGKRRRPALRGLLR